MNKVQWIYAVAIVSTSKTKKDDGITCHLHNGYGDFNNMIKAINNISMQDTEHDFILLVNCNVTVVDSTEKRNNYQFNFNNEVLKDKSICKAMLHLQKLILNTDFIQ